jgi:hypothetical protein
MGCNCRKRIKSFEVTGAKMVVLKFVDEICGECGVILRKILLCYPGISDISIRGRKMSFRVKGRVDLKVLKEELYANGFEIEQ